ncbi:hypothetical protein GCM10007112_20150 [Vulcanisaeta souniana JCM 11219]|uniref:Uncharacterized protein n=1 Tax=Vulcanisaeta souniana JCM 11219 TaxID=1293586 RepID=A0A830E9R3_9CREN|nr:hypothetical protein GCM10007112_20150 [Vulcanisaeta souniana JCM 11219]
MLADVIILGIIRPYANPVSIDTNQMLSELARKYMGSRVIINALEIMNSSLLVDPGNLAFMNKMETRFTVVTNDAKKPTR